MKEAMRYKGERGREGTRTKFDVFVNVTDSLRPEAINMPSRGTHTHTHTHTRITRTSLVAAVLLSYKGQSRDNYGARGTRRGRREYMRVCARERRRIVLLEMRMPLLCNVHLANRLMSKLLTARLRDYEESREFST